MPARLSEILEPTLSPHFLRTRCLRHSASRFAASRPKLRFSAAVSARAPCLRAIPSNSSAVKSSGLRARIVTTLGFDFARSVRKIEGDAGRVIFLEVAQGMAKDFSTS